MNVDVIQLDEETMAKVVQAAGDVVPILIVATTTAGHVVSLTVKASYVASIEEIRLQLPAIGDAA